MTCSDIFIWSILQTFLHYVSPSHYYAVWRMALQDNIFFHEYFWLRQELRKFLCLCCTSQSFSYSSYCQSLKYFVLFHWFTWKLDQSKILLMNQIFIQHLHLLIRCCCCHSSLDWWMNKKFTFTDYVRRRYLLLLSKNIWSEINKSEHLQETQLDWAGQSRVRTEKCRSCLETAPGQPAVDTQPAAIHAADWSWRVLKTQRGEMMI